MIGTYVFLAVSLLLDVWIMRALSSPGATWEHGKDGP